jgi:hypothetical protein
MSDDRASFDNWFRDESPPPTDADPGAPWPETPAYQAPSPAPAPTPAEDGWDQYRDSTRQLPPARYDAGPPSSYVNGAGAAAGPRRETGRSYGAQPQQPQQHFYGEQPPQPYGYGNGYEVAAGGHGAGNGDGRYRRDEDDYIPGQPVGEEPKRRKKGLIATATIVGVAALGLVGYLTLGSGVGGATAVKPVAAPKPTHTAFQPTSTDPALAAEQTGAAFLTAWESGDLQKAANLTDNPTAALTALTAYKTDLNLTSLALSPQPVKVAGATTGASASASSTATATAGAVSTASASSTATPAIPSGTVLFAAVATVAVTGKPTVTAPWSYSSKLTAYQVQGGWAVQWTPTILAPGMTATEQLAVSQIQPGVGEVTDAEGDNLAGTGQVALVNIAGILGKHAPTGSGTPGLAVQLTDDSGKVIPDTQATVQKAVDLPALKTTIDPATEELATTAVGQLPRSSMVVLQMSTGAILAIANSVGSPDTALTGTLAPGSTMKIITSTAALNLGLVTLYTPRGCPLTYTVQGVVYHNSTDSGGHEESLPDSTPFINDFAQSCNNAFTPFYTQLGGGQLASTASRYYGLNQPWDIGLGTPSQYFTMPTDASGAELAQEDFGQGQIEANPLAMASVASTVVAGSFHQPYLVAGAPKVTATPLPSGTDSDLLQLMHAVVSAPDGTAYQVFGSGYGLYGKTGTAEADSDAKGNDNGWITVVDPAKNVAICAVVINTPNDGAASAGPEAAYVLSHF